MLLRLVAGTLTMSGTEAEAAKQSRELKEKKQKIMEIIAAKQDESLHNMSVEDLQAMLNQLGG